MANPPCMSDDGQPAVFVGTMLETGDSVALCNDCLVGWAAAVLNVMTGVDPTPYLAAISDDAPPAPSGSDDPGAADNSAAAAPSDPPPPPKASGRIPRALREAGTDADPHDAGPASSSTVEHPAA